VDVLKDVKCVSEESKDEWWVEWEKVKSISMSGWWMLEGRVMSGDQGGLRAGGFRVKYSILCFAKNSWHC